MAVEPKRDHVCAVAERCEPAGVLDHGIKYVAMDNQQTASIGGDVYCLLRYLHSAKLQQRVVAQPFIVIARNIDDPRTLADLAQKLLDDVVMGLWPIPRPFQTPA